MVTSQQIRGTIGRARPALYASMLDTCVVRQPATTGQLNESTGLYETTAGTTVYSGRCRLESTSGSSDPTSRDDRPFAEVVYTLLLPWDADGFAVGQVVAITSSDDPAIADHTWRVSRVVTKTFRTHQELSLEEVQSDA